MFNHTFTLDKWHKILSQIHEKNQQNPHGIQVIYGIDAIHEQHIYLIVLCFNNK